MVPSARKLQIYTVQVQYSSRRLPEHVHVHIHIHIHIHTSSLPYTVIPLCGEGGLYLYSLMGRGGLCGSVV